MHRAITGFLGLLALSAACSGGANPHPGSAECAAYTSVFSLGVDPSFSAQERTDIARAASDWAVWSSGKVRIVLVSRNRGDAEITKVTAEDPRTKEEDAKINAAAGTTGIYAFGWSTRDRPGHIYIVSERLSPDLFYYTVAHEMSHSAGLKYPEPCGAPGAFYRENAQKYDCEHVADLDALMYPALTGKTFGAADLDMCRASCLCP